MELLHVASLIPDWPAFLKSAFGKLAFSCRIPETILERLLSGFADGDVAQLLAECRKADNTAYSADEREEMESLRCELGRVRVWGGAGGVAGATVSPFVILGPL